MPIQSSPIERAGSILARCAVLAALSWAGVACSARAPRLELSATRDVAGGTVELVLSHSPTAAAEARSGTDLVAAFDLDLTRADLGHAIDVEELPDGRIAALDRESPGLLFFDQEGRFLARGGREGEGPGELRSPIGLTRAGATLVISEARRDRALSIADIDGRPLRQFGPPVAGDWTRAAQRPPFVGIDIPWYPGAEDVALRTAPFDDASIAVIVATNEWETAPDPADADRMLPRPVALLRISSNNGKVIDTLWRGSTPAATREQSRADVMPHWPYPHFAARPLVASGQGWVAITDGATAEIQLIGGSGVRRLRWPPGRSRITEATKARQFDWVVQHQTRYSASWAAWWDSLGAATRAEARRSELERYPWAEHTPEVTAMHGAGRCLWIAGFAIADGPLGVGRSWVVVDVVEGRLVGTYRVPAEWTRLRSAGRNGVYATYRDEEGSSHLMRFRMPEEARRCAA